MKNKTIHLFMFVILISFFNNNRLLAAKESQILCDKKAAIIATFNLSCYHKDPNTNTKHLFNITISRHCDNREKKQNKNIRSSAQILHKITTATAQQGTRKFNLLNQSNSEPDFIYSLKRNEPQGITFASPSHNLNLKRCLLDDYNDPLETEITLPRPYPAPSPIAVTFSN